MNFARAEFDICVVGGGAAGLVVAADGANMGAKVILVERNGLGGDCLHYGCVPSKALLYCGKVAQTMRRAERFGIAPCAPDVDMTAVMERVQRVIRTIEVHDSPERFRALGVELVSGHGRFCDPSTLEVGGRKITARNFVLATGSRAAIPDIPGLDRVPYLTNENVFALREKVPSLIVLGGGPIGVEMAQAFSRLGSRVLLVNRSPQLLPNEDSDLVSVVTNRIRAEGVSLYLGYSCVRVEKQETSVRLWVTAPDGSELMLEAHHLLLATGRQPNIDDLGLEQAGIALRHGKIVAGRNLRTSNRRVFVCGDATGGYQFTHVAEHHARVVLRNILFHLPARVEERVIPWCTFTDPELARVGLSEHDARLTGIAHQVYTFPFTDIDRAQTSDETEGFVKILTTPRGYLLGAAIVGPHAGELIHEYALAMAAKIRLSSLSGMLHVYPTMAQINRRVAEVYREETLTPGVKKWLKRLFYLRGRLAETAAGET
ncbi:MAG: mercuric reductase [Sulfuricella denitrificans]|nr:mercuric reductase [Sulfuricella denitrificans]